LEKEVKMEEGEVRKSRTWVWALVIIIVLAGIGGGIYFFIKKDKATDSQETSLTR
jgi:flagellar basal body-associated protein FliL